MERCRRRQRQKDVSWLGLAWPGRGSDNGQITIEMMTETKLQPLTVQREQPPTSGRGG